MKDVKFEEIFDRVDGDAMTLALRFASEHFGIVPITRWVPDDKHDKPTQRTEAGDAIGGPLHPLVDNDAMSALLLGKLPSGKTIQTDSYMLALAPVGDETEHVLVCLDIDNAHGDGATPLSFDELLGHLAAWFDMLGCPDAMRTLATRTPHDGLHLFFWAPCLGWRWQDGLSSDDLPNVVALDWHPAAGRQHAMGPGSKRPLNNRRTKFGEYTLLVPKGQSADCLADAIQTIPDELFVWLVRASIKKQGGVRGLFPNASSGKNNVDFRIKRAKALPVVGDIIQQALADEKKASRKRSAGRAADAPVSCDEVGLWKRQDVVGQGGRHDALMHFVGTCLRTVTGKDFDDTVRLIEEEIIAFCENCCSPAYHASHPETRNAIRQAMIWASTDHKDEIEARVRNRVVVVDAAGNQSTRVIRDYGERVINGATYRCKLRKGGVPSVPTASPTNVVEALLHDDALGGCFAYDEQAARPVVVKPLPWSSSDEEFPRPATDTDRSEAICYLDEVIGQDFSRVFQVGFDKACNAAKFNPLKDFVRSLDGKWDGQSHIERLVSDWMGVGPEDEIDGKSFSGEVMRVWMRGAIRRALHPGSKVDLTVILQGPQGCGKSTFWQRLAMREDFLCESLTDVRDEARCWEQLSGRWVILVDELAALNRASDVARIKTFLTAQRDERRLPYAKLQTVRPRCCVFCGTTNDLSFLSDRTGNRRFVVVQTTGVWDEHGLPRFVNDTQFDADVRQCWAEAYALEAAAPQEPLVLPRWCRAEQTERNAAASVESPWTEPIARYLEAAATYRPEEPISFAQLYCDLQDCPRADYRAKARHLKSFQDEARRVAESLGWSYKRAFGAFGDSSGVKSQQWALVPPELTPDERVAIAEAAERARIKFEAEEAEWTGESADDASGVDTPPLQMELLNP